MVDPNKPKKDGQNRPLPSIDPEIEARVDKMMMPESKKSAEASSAQKDESSQTAPLLPGEKLPDFDRVRPKPSRPAEENPSPPPEQAEEYDSPIVSNPQTDKAVEDIVEEESDRMLAIEDAKAQLLAEGSAEIDRGFFSRIKSAIAGFWHNKWARYLTLIIIFAGIAAAAATPTSRYYILNALGVRASMSLRVIDDKTDQPLKGVDVSIDGVTGETDKNGNVWLDEIRLGEQQLSVRKTAFADFNEDITVGWGSNPIGDVSLTPVGSRYGFAITDYVSGKPIGAAEASSGEASARANKNGEIVLVVADQNESEVSIRIAAPGYRTETLKLTVGDKKVHDIGLVPAKKHAFVSKRSGTYDLYKIDIDGKNEKMILAGTGSESESTTFILPDPTDSNIIAYVATRGEHHNSAGTALSDLMMVNLTSDEVDTIDYSERMQLLGFVESKLVYIKIDPKEKDDSPKREQLVSYDLNTGEQKILDRANYFNDALIADGIVYYAPAKYQEGAKTGLFNINPDGSGKNTITGKEIWSILRVAYDRLDVSSEQDWFEYSLASSSLNALNSAPAEQQSRIYTPDAANDKSAWVDNRDGKGVLLVYDTSTGEDNVVHSQSGLSNPLSWLDAGHLIYRVKTGSETADYVISISGGEPKKIKDVTNTPGLDSWYYY